MKINTKETKNDKLRKRKTNFKHYSKRAKLEKKEQLKYLRSMITNDRKFTKEISYIDWQIECCFSKKKIAESGAGTLWSIDAKHWMYGDKLSGKL